MTNFTYLKAEWPEVWESAARAEAAMHRDPRAAGFYARRALELAVALGLTQPHSALRRPYPDNLSALIHEPTFKRAVGEAVFTKAKIIISLGNRAVHNVGPVLQADATAAIRELFHVSYWFAHT